MKLAILPTYNHIITLTFCAVLELLISSLSSTSSSSGLIVVFSEAFIETPDDLSSWKQSKEPLRKTPKERQAPSYNQ